mgnify:CR=1 FL=1
MEGNNKNLTFGFDIGIASVGWAVLSESRVIDLGVRCFDAAEDKDGKPNNQTRRGARVSRNRYRMRSWRLKRLVRLFRDAGMISSDEIKLLIGDQHPKKYKIRSPWELRSLGLSKQLTPYEWAQTIYHIVKHRGFKFYSKIEDPTAVNGPDNQPVGSTATQEQKEFGALKDGLEFTTGLRRKYPQFKTIGNIAWHLANAPQDRDGIYRGPDGEALDIKDCEDFQESFRNKNKSYRHAFHRDDLRDELTVLFDTQKAKGNSFTNYPMPDRANLLDNVQIGSQERTVERNFRDQVFALFELQHPPIYTAQMDALIGRCELEENKLRAPKHCFSNERRTWLETLNHLRIKPSGGKERELSDAERTALIDLPYTLSKVTFKQARDVLREKTGFPMHWREASFTKVSYASKRKNDGSWINVVSADGSRTVLGKYGDEKTRKDANKMLKIQLEAGAISYAELRSLYQVNDGDTFEEQKRDEQVILPSLESQYAIPFDALDNKQAFIKILPAKATKSTTLAKFSKKAMNVLATLRTKKPGATLSDLRLAMEQTETHEIGWQFEFSKKTSIGIQPDHEQSTQIPIEYEDAQAAEAETLIEMKGWHAMRRELESAHSAWWNELQAAWCNASATGEVAKTAATSAANMLDAVAEVLTKAQTDADIRTGLTAIELTSDQAVSLLSTKKIFKDYRNLSLTAIRKILPFLEQKKGYSEACSLAGYKQQTHQRTRHLPPLETYLYERIRHGKKTGYSERRYKDLNNPVVARAFNQARVVLNALIDKHGSPAYVHIELARDIARPLKGRWSGGKYIEGRLDIKRRQDESRNKRKAIRENFSENYKINAPTEQQMLKERLYHEQQSKCAYTLQKLDPNRVVDDENYAQIDHIWPRSITFDNSLDNLVLVHAHANQDKGNRIPFDYINSHPRFGANESLRAEHWRQVQAHILSCKGMADGKIKRLLATELDSEEFLARNLVDTRYTTRLFARMVRDRLLFEGQFEDRTEDIDPSESGKKRLEKFHKTRVRTPQGGVTAFLRRAWLGNIKDREASDKHHAIDACIVAACTPSLIKKVNDWFAHQERAPNQFSRNADGTYTDRRTGETKISKQEARERGLYLIPPDGFRDEFKSKYEQLVVSRAVQKKRNNELHDANPIGHRHYPVKLTDLTQEIFDRIRLPPDLPITRINLIDSVREHFLSCNGDANTAFRHGFKTKNAEGKDKVIHTLPLPLVALPDTFIAKEKQYLPHGSTENFLDTAIKNVPLTSLTLKKLDEKELGTAFYNRNKRMVESIKEQIRKFDGDAEKAFVAPFYPFGPSRPPIKSIRLPAPRGSGIHVRGGASNLGDALYTEMYRYNGTYWFRPRYKISEEASFGLPVMPRGAQHVCNFRKNDFVRIKHPNMAHCYRETRRYRNTNGDTIIEVSAISLDGVFEGYWNYFEPSNDRPVVQLHDASTFFLLEDGKTLKSQSLLLIAKSKAKKAKTKGIDELEYFEFGDVQQDRPLKFSQVRDIKRKVGDAAFIEKVKIDVLGVIDGR